MDGYHTIDRDVSLFDVFDINTLRDVPRKPRFIKIEPGLTIINGNRIKKIIR